MITTSSICLSSYLHNVIFRLLRLVRPTTSAGQTGCGLRKVLLEVLQTLHRMLQRVDILAEGEPGICLADRSVLFAVKLMRHMVSVGMHGCRRDYTSLTGMEETPTSIAINQHALRKSGCRISKRLREGRNAALITHLKSRPRPRTLSGNG